MKTQLSPSVARCLLAAAILAFPAPAMLATGLTYYVATNESDSNNGSADLYVTKPAGRGFGYADALFLVQALEE